MPKRTKTTLGIALVLVVLFASPAFTQTYSRTITAWFNNLTVKLDGEVLSLEGEPFIYNNELYMPVEELADLLYLNLNYDEEKGVISIDSNRLNVTDPDSSVIPVAFQKNYQIDSLNKRIAELETEISLLKSGRLPYERITSLSEMESYLRENFKMMDDVEMTLQLRSVGKNQLRLEAYFKGSDASEWTNLNRRDIEGWVDDIFYAIRELYNEDAIIQGDIRRGSYRGSQYATYWTRGSRLFYDFRLAEHKENLHVDSKKIEDALSKRLKRYDNASFTYEVFVNEYDIDVIATFNKNVTKWTPHVKMRYLKRLKTEVERVYDDVNVYGQLIEEHQQEPLVSFSFDGDLIRSEDLLDEVEEYLDKHYKTFKYDGDTFTFTYRVTEGPDDTLTIDLEGDFERSDRDWQQVEAKGEYKFKRFIQDAYRYVEGLWDVDIYGEVVDENLEHITDIEFYGSGGSSTRSVQSLSF